MLRHLSFRTPLHKQGGLYCWTGAACAGTLYIIGMDAFDALLDRGPLDEEYEPSEQEGAFEAALEIRTEDIRYEQEQDAEQAAQERYAEQAWLRRAEYDPRIIDDSDYGRY